MVTRARARWPSALQNTEVLRAYFLLSERCNAELFDDIRILVAAPALAAKMQGERRIARKEASTAKSCIEPAFSFDSGAELLCNRQGEVRRLGDV